MGKIKINNKLLQSIPDTLERKVAYYRGQGHEIPEMKLIKTPEQIEGIRRSGIVNTGILDLARYLHGRDRSVRVCLNLLPKLFVSH